jgi:hypothetical protein
MFPQWGYTIPVSVFMLGACSVYDSSLLSTSPIVQSGAGGTAGSGVAGTGGLSAGAGSSGGREAEPEAGAAGLSTEMGGNGASAGSGATAGGAQGGTGGAAGGAAGGTGGTSSGGKGGTAGAPVLALETIDTMEDHDGAIDNTGSRNGDWYAGHDATATGVQTPGSSFAMTALPTTDTRYNASTDKWAAMTKGMGFNDWGEDMGLNMMLVPVGEMYHPAYNATGYCGIHFYGRVGVGANPNVIVRVPDKYSLPDGGQCTAGVGTTTPCYAYYQKVYSFSTNWTEYNVLFTDLHTSGWPPKFAQDAIFSVEFGLPSHSVFELWIDDISFLKKPAGGSCPTVYP